MSAKRLADTFITERAYKNGQSAPVMNLAHGNQFGYMPHYGEMVSTTPFVRQNMIPVLMTIPKGFDDLPNKDDNVNALKALMEQRALSITGINDNLTVGTDTSPFGPTEVVEVPTGVSRDQLNPSYSWQEVEGRAISNFWYNYILMLIENPDIRAPGAIATAQGSTRTDRLMDYYSFTMLYIEPNINMNRAVNALLIGNMFPKSTGNREMGFDKTASHQISTVDVDFSGLTQRGYGVKDLAQNILDRMNYIGADPRAQKAFTEKLVDADVDASVSGILGGVVDAVQGAKDVYDSIKAFF